MQKGEKRQNSRPDPLPPTILYKITVLWMPSF
jgi:hypothetical protein